MAAAPQDYGLPDGDDMHGWRALQLLFAERLRLVANPSRKDEVKSPFKRILHLECGPQAFGRFVAAMRLVLAGCGRWGGGFGAEGPLDNDGWRPAGLKLLPACPRHDRRDSLA